MTEQEHARIAEAIRGAEAEHGRRNLLRRGAQRATATSSPAAMVVTVSILVISLAVAFLMETWWLTMRLPVFVSAQLLALAAALALVYALPGLAHQAGAASLAIHAARMTTR